MGLLTRQALLSVALCSALSSLVRGNVCRCLPGDDCWPDSNTWSIFNESIDGRLVATVPLGSPCHGQDYNSAVCSSLQSQWTKPALHYETSSSIMAPFFANQSCDPFTAPTTPCLLGNYVVYAVNVSKPEHISASLRFCTEHNIRPVIRNTGHDYNGKSTGAGGLGIWTHDLKDIEVITNYEDNFYQGAALKMGAGVQGSEAYAAADKSGLQVVGGECPTVGLAGGYTQGGGHSALASLHGLAADQALQWEVVDGTGQLITATREENADLFWALSGGGGGTYGVVTALTVKAHPDVPVSSFNLTFSSSGISQDTYYQAIGNWHSSLAQLVDKNAMAVWFFTNTSFAVSPVTAPGMTAGQLQETVQPWLDSLDQAGIQYTSVFRDFDGYLNQFQTMQGPIDVGIAQYGGWLIPRDVVATKNDELTSAYRSITEDGAQFIGVAVNVSQTIERQGPGGVDNAVLPAWRTALIDTVLTTPWNFTAPWSYALEQQRKMTEDYIPRLRALAPESGCYLNEGDFRQPDFQQVFYGSNYERLLAIKDKYDPHSLFYATTAVGSDRWTIQPDSRLCRAGM